MSDILLATKIRVPLLRSQLVNRPHLIGRLNDAIVPNNRLILLSAPAGYGKSTLLSEWVSQLQYPVAWLSLEKGENTPARFWNYFITALHTIPALCNIGHSVIQALQARRPASVEESFSIFVNELARLEEPIVLVLDDLHTITERKIHESLIFLIEHLPLSTNGFHLVVASRMDPPWPLARWRARDQLMEIRTLNMRFDPGEAADFLNRVMKLGLSLENVQALENRTEGWIAGLQMAAISLQDRRDIGEFIQAFIGNTRYIFDYLMEEVLNHQERETQEFLLKTSILEYLSAPLCDAVLGYTDSQSRLDQLISANLFLLPLDDKGVWYRFHPLFADLLKSSVRRNQPESVPELHRKACAWFDAHGFMPEALAHALAAGDLERLAQSVERYAFTVMEVHEATALLGWLDSLPESTTDDYPWLNIARAWLLAYLGMNDRIEGAIRAAEKSADSADRRIQGYIAAMKALASELGARQLDDGIVQGRRALELLPQDEFRPRAFVCYHLANMLSWQGDVSAALQLLKQSSTLGFSAGDPDLALTAQFETANILRGQGRLKESKEVFEAAIQSANDDTLGLKLASLPIGFAYLQKALIYLEWNELDKSLQLAREGLQLCRSWGYSDYLYNGLLIYASILYETGDLEGALGAVHEAKRFFSEKTPRSRASALEAVIHQARGDLANVAAWLSVCGMHPTDIPDFVHRLEYFRFALILKEQGKLGEAYQILEGLRNTLENAEANNLYLKVLIEQALVTYSLGEEAKSIGLLQHALEMAEPEGYLRVFINCGAKMNELLGKAVSADVGGDFAKSLLGRYPGLESIASPEMIHPDAVATEEPPSLLVEPLSKRELEVLRWLNTRLDCNEIAAELFLSVSTVRTHIKNIYSKLNVNRRMQAIERARALKLL